ncbi:MAG: diguanylate cyclase [Desulfobacterales bacterium]
MHIQIVLIVLVDVYILMLRLVSDGRDGYKIEHRIIREDTGETRYVHEKCLHERGPRGEIIRSVGIVQDITERKRAEKDLEAIVDVSSTILAIEDFPIAARRIFDSLSGLVGSTSGYVALLSEDGKENEMLFLESGGRSCSVNPDLPMPIRGLRAKAYTGNKVAYDNDFMNSQWMKNMRAADILIRWGGEEFLVVAPDTDVESAAVLAERLRKTIAGNKFSGPGKVTASFGIAKYQKGDCRDGLIDRADHYMYPAKQKGRNRVEAGE